MGRYLKRVEIKTSVPGIESFYYARNGGVPVSEMDDVVIDLDKPFECPDCSSTFLYKMTFMKDNPWFHDKYICENCRAIFIERRSAEQAS